jgi:hypothetical protein
MADQRDAIAQAMMSQNTGGLSQQDFNTFSTKLNDPTALQSWLDKGGVYGQYGGQPPDPYEQYFAPRGPISHSGDEMNWMNALQPNQGGASGTLPGTGINTSGFIGGGSMRRADPAYWGWQGPHQGFAPGSIGAQAGGGQGSTGGLTPQDFAIFSRLVSPEALQQWLDAGGVQGQFGGGMGGAVGGAAGGAAGGGGVSHGHSGITATSNAPGVVGPDYSNLQATQADTLNMQNMFDYAFDNVGPNTTAIGPEAQNPGIGSEGENEGEGEAL